MGKIAKHHVILVITLLLIILGSKGCSARNPSYTAQQQIYAKYAGKIELAAEIHKEAMIALGRAHAEGLISSQQLQTARDYGKVVELALREGKATLILYLEGKSTRDVLLTALGSIDLKLAALFEVLERFGVYGKVNHE